MRATTTLLLAGALVFAGCSDDDDSPMQPTPQVFTAALSGAGEVPPVDTNGSGTATFTAQGDEVVFTIQVQNMTAVTAAHIHAGAAGANGGVVVPLFARAAGVDITNGMLVSSSFTEADIVAETGATMASLLAMMASGGAYVNVHTMANPPGEIRGQTQSQ